MPSLRNKLFMFFSLLFLSKQMFPQKLKDSIINFQVELKRGKEIIVVGKWNNIRIGEWKWVDKKTKATIMTVDYDNKSLIKLFDVDGKLTHTITDGNKVNFLGFIRKPDDKNQMKQAEEIIIYSTNIMLDFFSNEYFDNGQSKNVEQADGKKLVYWDTNGQVKQEVDVNKNFVKLYFGDGALDRIFFIDSISKNWTFKEYYYQPNVWKLKSEYIILEFVDLDIDFDFKKVKDWDSFLRRDIFEITKGSIIAYFSNGNINIKGGMFEGKEFGEVIEYYENGKIKLKGNFIDNKKKNGEFIEYFESGNLKSKHNYVKGKEVGPFENYYSNGAVESKGTRVIGLNDNSELDGKYVYYYGGPYALFTDAIYKNGKIMDGFKCYYEDTISINPLVIKCKKQYFKSGNMIKEEIITLTN